MSRKLKVNIVLPYLSNMPGGGLKVMYQYANLLAKKGHDVVVYHSMYTAYTQVGRLFRKRKYTFTQKYLRIPRLRRPVWFNLLPVIKSFEIVKIDNALIRDADIIIGTWWATATEIYALNKTKGQKFNLIQDYEAIMTSYPLLVDQSFKLNLHHIVVSDYLADVVAGISGDRPPVIPNSVDTAQYFIEVPIEDRNPLSICMLYADDKRKGSAYGIAALKIVAQKYPNLAVNLFGVYGKPAIPFPNTFKYHHLPDNLRQIYNNAAIFISPSIHEGWGLPPMEAMACGCSCVCTNIEGHLNFMTDQETVLFVEPENPGEMAQKIIRLIENDALRLQLARAANKHIQQFSWQKSVDTLEQSFFNSLNN